MITINLLPQEYRVVERKKISFPALKWALLAGIVMVFVSAFFYVEYLSVKGEAKRLNEEWARWQPQQQELNQLQSLVDGELKSEMKFMAAFVTSNKTLPELMLWSSQYLPETSWLTEIRLQREEGSSSFVLRGLAFRSREKTSIEQIEEYLHHLKKEMPDADLSLTTTRQTQEGIELTQFTAIYQWSNVEG